MDSIFNTDDKPKPKRALTPKQLEALEKGRQKREQQRLLKLEQEATKEHTETNKKARQTKKNLLKHQEEIKQNIINNDENLKREKKLEEFKKKYRNEINKKLETIEDPILFKTVRTFFNKYNIEEVKDINEFKSRIKSDFDKLNNK